MLVSDDDVSANNHNGIYLAYIERDIILKLLLKSGMAPQVLLYYKMCRLFQSLYARFREADQQTNISEFKCSVS